MNFNDLFGCNIGLCDDIVFVIICCKLYNFISCGIERIYYFGKLFIKFLI